MEEKKNEVMQEIVANEDVCEESYKSGTIQYIDSREVAEIVEKKHTDLIRDIKRYKEQIDGINQEYPKSKIAFSDFFIESSYSVEGQNRTYPCYLVTRKGCEFIAHKLNGKKGTKFTTTYINRFHEMEDVIKGKEQTQIEELTKQVAELRTLLESLNNQPKASDRLWVNPYGSSKSIEIEERKKELYSLTARVAGLCKISQTKVLHYMYRTLEEDLEVVLDDYKSVYIFETGKKDACMIEVIAANEKIYNVAVEMNKSVIERKQIYG